MARAGKALGAAVAVAVAVAACSGSGPDTSPGPSIIRDPGPPAAPTAQEVSGILTAAGEPVAGARVSLGDAFTVTAADGSFVFHQAAPGAVTTRAAGFEPAQFVYAGGDVDLTLRLEERPLSRALRVYSEVARDDTAFAALLQMAAATTVNTLVFDTKDETHRVLHDTTNETAHAIGAVDVRYDAQRRIGEAHAAGLYTVTRVVTFYDATWVAAAPAVALAGDWADPVNEAAWRYPLDLAAEACALGFDEVQFDYVRFPTGSTGRTAQRERPTTEQVRNEAIAGFLTEARDLLHPLGCAVSADIFGIVMSIPNDQGLGQSVETVTAPLDAVSPMLYPSHYSDGWLGFADPNSHPGEVISQALDVGTPRVADGVQMRPWIQAFGYSADQVLAQINACEARGAGWILWNYTGSYDVSWLPPASDGDAG